MAEIDPEGAVVQDILHGLVDKNRYYGLVDDALDQVQFDIDDAILEEFLKRCKAAGIEADTALRDDAENWVREAGVDGEALVQEYLKNASGAASQEEVRE